MNCENILTNLRAYDPNFDEERITKAINFAIHYHKTRTRETKTPHYHHPLAVAKIVTKMRLDSDAVITALLHHTIEGTELTIKEIQKNFGDEVAKLVDGVTKLSKIEFMPDNVWQAENFRKLLLAMSDDIRVLLVKLADCLNNMRTIDNIKSPEKRMRIALETKEIYAPLAERIGIQQIKGELQDIYFKVLQPDVRNSILRRLETISNNENHLVEKIINEIQVTLNGAKVRGKIYGRLKTPYSIWIKMQQKNVGLDQLYDIIAFRIIVDKLEECYQVLGLIHIKYKMVPDSFQDFISTPKNNGYQSLHTVVIGPLQQKIEIQIRTRQMHEIAELGVAAHWRYKQKYPEVADSKQYRWIRELLAILEQAGDLEDFLQNTKLAMYYDQVFCFTPKGRLIALPKGATPVDFAYAVHSNVGHACVGAKVNGRIVPLKSILKNGDQIEIVMSKGQSPSPSWEKFVITGKAHSEIRRFIRSQQKSEYIKLGKTIIAKALRTDNTYSINAVLTPTCLLFKKKTVDELLYAIGDGSLRLEEVIKQIGGKNSKSSPLALLGFDQQQQPILIQTLQEQSDYHNYSDYQEQSDYQNYSDYVAPFQKVIPKMITSFAECCRPLPGDKIVGVINNGCGAVVHIVDCELLSNCVTQAAEIINLTWNNDTAQAPFIYRLKITMLNEPGSLAIIASEIAKHYGNIINFKVINRSPDFFEALFDIGTFNSTRIDHIVAKLQAKKNIHLVERYQR